MNNYLRIQGLNVYANEFNPNVYSKECSNSINDMNVDNIKTENDEIEMYMINSLFDIKNMNKNLTCFDYYNNISDIEYNNRVDFYEMDYNKIYEFEYKMEKEINDMLRTCDTNPKKRKFKEFNSLRKDKTENTPKKKKT